MSSTFYGRSSAEKNELEREKERVEREREKEREWESYSRDRFDSNVTRFGNVSIYLL